MSIKFELTKDQIRALLEIAAKRDVRHYLCGVHINASAGRLEVCDSAMVFVIAHEISGKGSVIIPRDTLEQVARLIKAPIDVAAFECLDGAVTVSVGSSTVTARALDARYPEIQRVIPLELSGEPAQFDPRLTARLGKAFAFLAGDTRASAAPGMQIQHNGEAAALVGHPGAPDAFAAIMPFRHEPIDLLALANRVLDRGDAAATDTAAA